MKIYEYVHKSRIEIFEINGVIEITNLKKLKKLKRKKGQNMNGLVIEVWKFYGSVLKVCNVFYGKIKRIKGS